jgi:hypothetical protein
MELFRATAQRLVLQVQVMLEYSHPGVLKDDKWMMCCWDDYRLQQKEGKGEQKGKQILE